MQTAIAFTSNAPQHVNRPLPTHKPKQIKPGNKKVVTHNVTASSPAKGKEFVTRKAGRQDAHEIPQFLHETTGEHWDCLTSGFYQRYDSDGTLVSGVLLHVDTINLLFADVPAKHPYHYHCMTAVNRRF